MTRGTQKSKRHQHFVTVSLLLGVLSIAGVFAMLLSAPQDARGQAGGTCEATGGADCFYVAVNGNDTNPGTFASPFLTFRPALVAATPGDIIYARGGTYDYDNAMTAGGGVSVFISIQNVSGQYTLNNGTSGSPITVKKYPGETPILDYSDARFLSHTDTNVLPAVEIREKSYWTIDGFDIQGGVIDINTVLATGGGSGPTSNGSATHHIVIKNNNIHDVVIDNGNNPGLIRINRGDNGGADNIFIQDNLLHDLYDTSSPTDWHGGLIIHFGAVTTLSREAYAHTNLTEGTKYIEITGNTIYNIPQAFYFKNPMEGPILIQDNIIYDVNAIAYAHAANVHFISNLVYNVSSGFDNVGREDADPGVLALAGQDYIIRNNTFVGFHTLFGLDDGASVSDYGLNSGVGHTITKNVFFGMRGRTPGATLYTPAYIFKTRTVPDNNTPAQSVLQTITSDQNCFITQNADFLHTKRDLVSASDEYYTRQQALTTFGFDANSTFITQANAALVFTNPGAHDYHLLAGIESQCPTDVGYYAASSGDVTPPTVSVTAPASGATVSGASVTVSASAADNTGVVGVQLKVDGVNIGSEDTSAPYSVTWNSTSVSNASHTITAVARDAAGNSTTSAGITVTVNNVVPDTTDPTVNLTAPTNGATVSGTVSITANASDNIGVVGVQFRLDGANLGTEDMSAPYATSWNTTGATNGSHAVTAIARDAAGNTTTATTITVTVHNSIPDTTSPAPVTDLNAT